MEVNGFQVPPGSFVEVDAIDDVLNDMSERLEAACAESAKYRREAEAWKRIAVELMQM